MIKGIHQRSRYQCLPLLLTLMNVMLLVNLHLHAQSGNKTGTLKISFSNTVNGEPLVLNDTVYTNVFGEPYRVSKFKYYISDPLIKNKTGQQRESNGYHLVDAALPASQSFAFAVKPGQYQSVLFLLGIDSARNCSGAQTGALDPLNDMFWTWNSGYVMAKLEGSSTASSAINQRLEYHIGGYRGKDNVVQLIRLDAATPIVISPGKTTELHIETDIAKWWQLNDPVTIRETPACSTPGPVAKRIAANYRNMFTLKSVKNN